MANYFNYFPIIPYDFGNKEYKTFTNVTNVFFRLRVLRSVLNNTFAYYEYIVQDSDTPEILAEKFYGDAEAHWIVMMANDMIDAAYDWPLSDKNFKNYLINKYKNTAANTLNIAVSNTTDSQVLAWTQTNYHHYEKVIQRTESLTGFTTEVRYEINKSPLSETIYYANNALKTDVQLFVSNTNGTFSTGNTVNTANSTFVGTIVSYNSSNGYTRISSNVGYFSRNQVLQVANVMSTNGIISHVYYPTGSLLSDKNIHYYSYDDLPEVQDFEVYNMGYKSKNVSNTLVNSGRTISEVTKRDAITYYDYELQVNENKRTIKIIKPEYYGQIMREFNQLSETEQLRSPYIRTLTLE